MQDGREPARTFPKPPDFIEGRGRRFVVVPTLSIIVANGQEIEDGGLA